jgi:PAS domain S-box-containing protein
MLRLGTEGHSSIRRELLWTTMLATAVALVVVVATIGFYDINTFRSLVVSDAEANASITGLNAASAVVFGDREAATQNLAAFRGLNLVLGAAIYDAKGNLFASYRRTDAQPIMPERLEIPARDDSSISQKQLRTRTRIMVDREPAGTLYVIYDLTPLSKRLIRYATIVIVVLCVSLLAALATGMRLQKAIANPILHLADTAKRVRAGNEYSLRANVTGKGEIATLIDSFNAMLEQIQLRDRNLRRYEALVAHTSNSIIVMDLSGTITSCNRAACNLYGYEIDDLVGKPFSILTGEDSGAIKVVLGQVAAGRAVQDSEGFGLRKNGSKLALLRTYSPIPDENGRIVGASSIGRDITAQKQAEQKLLASETRYRSLVLATAQIVWSTDQNGNVVGPLPLWQQFTGQSEEQVQGAGWSDAVHPDDREATLAIWRAAIETKSAYDVEYRIRRFDGVYRYFAVRGVPIVQADGGIQEWVGTCSDIDDRKRAERELRELNEQLEDRVTLRTAELAATNRELEAFTYSVAHDLRAPLRHINGFAKILASECAATLPPAGKRYLDHVCSGATQMGTLIDELLEFSRLGRRELDVSITGMNSIVEEVVARLRQEQGDRNVEWKIGRLPFVECDAALLRQVFVNLLSNALKYTRPRDPAVIEVNCNQNGDGPVIFVRDNGVGFSMRHADKLFGVFQRLHRSEDFEGTGVGLATAQRIVHKHAGRIWAEAELDKGATFYFTLGMKTESHEKAGAA